MPDTVNAWVGIVALQLVWEITKKTAEAPADVRIAFPRPSECSRAILAEIVKVHRLGNSSASQAA